MTIFGVIRRKAKPARKPVERISDLFISTGDFMLVNGEAIFLEKGRKQR